MGKGIRGKEINKHEPERILEECACVRDVWLSEKGQRQVPNQNDWVGKMA